MADDEQDTLRAHIRNLLLDYALTHLTRDYVSYTKNLIAVVRRLADMQIFVQALAV